MLERSASEHDAPFPSTLMTSHTSSPPTSLPTIDSTHRQSALSGSSYEDALTINNDAGSTGKGILIGILSAFGSAGVAVLVLAIFFFFKYTNRGRIILDRIGRPGEYDDEQAFIREEAEALETMDELQMAEYLRAKGMSPIPAAAAVNQTDLILYSIHPSKSTGNSANRYLFITVSCNPRKRSFGLGIRTRVGDSQLLRRSQDGDRVLRFRVQCAKQSTCS